MIPEEDKMGEGRIYSLHHIKITGISFNKGHIFFQPVPQDVSPQSMRVTQDDLRIRDTPAYSSAENIDLFSGKPVLFRKPGSLSPGCHSSDAFIIKRDKNFHHSSFSGFLKR
jgi:hypothetical protein